MKLIKKEKMKFLLTSFRRLKKVVFGMTVPRVFNFFKPFVAIFSNPFVANDNQSTTQTCITKQISWKESSKINPKSKSSLV